MVRESECGILLKNPYSLFGGDRDQIGIAVEIGDA